MKPMRLEATLALNALTGMVIATSFVGGIALTPGVKWTPTIPTDGCCCDDVMMPRCRRCGQPRRAGEDLLAIAVGSRFITLTVVPTPARPARWSTCEFIMRKQPEEAACPMEPTLLVP